MNYFCGWEVEKTELWKSKNGGVPVKWGREAPRAELGAQEERRADCIWLIPFEGFYLDYFIQSLYTPMADSILSLILEERKLRS